MLTVVQLDAFSASLSDATVTVQSDAASAVAATAANIVSGVLNIVLKMHEISGP
jgi:hypothetical protein